MRNNYKNFKRNEPNVIANERITYTEVRVNDVDGSSDVMLTSHALQIAQDRELDLILIADKANPPVCKIASLNKFIYEKKQKEKDAKKRQRENIQNTKEIRMTLNIDIHDLETKTRNAKKFLDKKDKVQITVVLKGRERGKTDAARQLLAKFAELCQTKLENVNNSGNRISAVLKNELGR